MPPNMNEEGEENKKFKLQFSVYQFHCAVIMLMESRFPRNALPLATMPTQ
jgi:hypothetical protein